MRNDSAEAPARKKRRIDNQDPSSLKPAQEHLEQLHIPNSERRPLASFPTTPAALPRMTEIAAQLCGGDFARTAVASTVEGHASRSGIEETGERGIERSDSMASGKMPYVKGLAAVAPGGSITVEGMEDSVKEDGTETSPPSKAVRSLLTCGRH